MIFSICSICYQLTWYIVCRISTYFSLSFFSVFTVYIMLFLTNVSNLNRNVCSCIFCSNLIYNNFCFLGKFAVSFYVSFCFNVFELLLDLDYMKRLRKVCLHLWIIFSSIMSLFSAFYMHRAFVKVMLVVITKKFKNIMMRIQ